MDAPAPSLGIDENDLTPIVRRALGTETAEVIDWRAQMIHGGAGRVLGWAGVYRVAGEARDTAGNLDWSIVLKVILTPERGGDSHHMNEVRAYQSGLLDSLPAGLSAPRCLALEKRGGLFYVWLEELHDDVGARWPVEFYGSVARQLGQFNGAFLAGRPLPSFPWAASGLLRSLAAEAESRAGSLRSLMSAPLARRVYPESVAEETLRLWTERHLFLDALDRLPRTFGHNDAFRRNLFARRSADGATRCVAIDWALAGPAAIGAELSALVRSSLVFSEVDLDQASDLERVAFEGYHQGLGETGWNGDPRLVRAGYAAATSLRFGVLLPLTTSLPILQSETKLAAMARAIGRPDSEVLDNLAYCQQCCLALAAETRSLMTQLELS